VASVAVKNGQFSSVREIQGLPFILGKTGKIDLAFQCSVDKADKYDILMELMS